MLTIDILLPINLDTNEGGCRATLAENIEAHKTKIVERIELDRN
jgi:hypothetical protein